MNFDFSTEQQQWRDQLRRQFAANAPLGEARAVLEGRSAMSTSAWSLLSEMGALGAAAPEDLGGVGLGRLELCVAAEEIGRALAPVPYVSSIGLALEAVLRFGSPDQKKALVEPLASGSMIGCAAFGEAAADGGAAKPQTHLTAKGVSGVKSPVADGNLAHIAIVLAQDGAGTSLFVAKLDGPGVKRRPLRTVDPSKDHAEITFENAAVERLGDAGASTEKAQALIERAAILMAFEQIGGAERALEMAIDYARTREAFGRLIGSYQAVKHKLADMYIKIQIARAHAYYGAWALETDAPDLPQAAAAARVAATEAFSYTAQEALQTHGGIGFTWEHDCQLFYRRARLLALELGAAPQWRERLVDQLERRNAA